METVSSENGPVKAKRGPLQAQVREELNRVVLEISHVQRRIGWHLGLRDTDLECYNIIRGEGPLTPTVLGRRAGLRTSTVTGILDRLERDGWVVRERDLENRRQVRVRALRDRERELFTLLAGMSTAMGDILADHSLEELELIHDFLVRTVTAGREAADELAAE